MAARSGETLISFREGLIAALLYLAVLACAYPNVFFKGKSLVYTDNFNPSDERMLAQNYGVNFVPARVWRKKNYLLHPNFHDPGATWWQWEPAAEFLRKGLAKGELPFWDPYVAAGAPAMTNIISSLAFPPYVLFVLAGNTSFLRNFYYLSMLLGAGFFTYLFLRKHLLSREASFAGGVVVILSGGLAQNVGAPMGQTAECLPFLLYITRRWLDRPTRNRTIGLAAGFATASLASFPPLLIANFGVVALYVTSMVIFSPPFGSSRLRTLGRFAGTALLAGGLVAFYYLPFVFLVRSTPDVSKLYETAGLGFLPPACVFQLLSPALLAGSSLFIRTPVTDPFYVDLPYIGIAPLALALLLGRTRSRVGNGLLGVSLTGTVLLGLKMFGVQPVQSLGRLPLLKSVHFALYFGLTLGILVALLAAFGVEKLVSGGMTKARAIFALLGVSAMLVGLHATAVAAGLHQSPLLRLWHRFWYILVGFAILSLVAIAGGAFAREHARLFAWAAIAVCVIEGAFNSFYPRQYTWNVWRHPVPYAQTLQGIAGRDRVLGVGALTANLGSAYEVFEIDSLMAFNPDRIRKLYHRYFKRNDEIFLREANSLPDEGVLDRADLRYVVIREAIPKLIAEAQRRGYESIFADGYVRIFRRESSPRYYFTSDYQVAPPYRALDLAGSQPPGKRVVVEEPLGFPPAQNGPADPPVATLDFHRNSLTLGLDAPRPGLVYCAESYFDGWSATVNDRPAKILPANYAFRAVEVPAGQVRIHFSYWPPGLSAGLLVTALSATALAIIFGVSARSPRT